MSGDISSLAPQLTHLRLIILKMTLGLEPLSDSPMMRACALTMTTKAICAVAASGGSSSGDRVALARPLYLFAINIRVGAGTAAPGLGRFLLCGCYAVGDSDRSQLD